MIDLSLATFSGGVVDLNNLLADGGQLLLDPNPSTELPKD